MTQPDTDLFACDRCGCVDILSENPEAKNDWLCLCCRGKPWHGLFPRRQYDPEKDLVCNQPTGLGLS